ncbi:MAG: ATP-binding protein [Crocinitomicaceae bacterium]|nr:ATP-binding protein [Crocinitomicaceae bacterium]
MNPIHKYQERFLQLKTEKEIKPDSEVILKLIETDSAGLNNYFMAALGMSTLILRFGAVIQLCQKFENLDKHGDALFLKQILDNLRESLPSDTSWKNLWALSAEDDAWLKPVLKPKNAETLLNRFITFRNRYVHQLIRIEEGFLPQMIASITLFDEMAELTSLFKDGDLVCLDGKYVWKQNDKIISLHPYVQAGKKDDDPYIFQGLYDNKSQAHLLNLRLGDEVEQPANDHLEPNFTPIREAIRGGAGQVFDHSERIAYYQSCFVGRDREKASILDFCASSAEQNLLCLKSPAGMGKGALIADVIEQLKEDKIQVLYHFCGAGIQNSLHATLYHFIIQGQKSQYWEVSDESIQRKLERLPSKYIDVIHLFQALLSEHFKIQSKNTSGNLVILIDGLDEAQVAYVQLKISDWFYTYNEKEEPQEDWRSETNIRWIFTYRCDDDGTESFFQFPKMKELAEIPLLQPLTGLSPEAVDEVLKSFNVSKEFKEMVIEKAEIIQ